MSPSVVVVVVGSDARSVVEVAQPVGPEHVQVTLEHLGKAGEHAVEVVVHGQVAAGEAVGVTGRDPQQQLGGPCRVGSASFGERVQRPCPDVRFVRAHRGLGRDRLRDPDRAAAPGGR